MVFSVAAIRRETRAMTAIMPLKEGQTGPDFDTLLRIWLMPAQLGLELMESSIAMLAGTFPTPRAPLEKGEAERQDIARAAEEQAAHIDDGPDTIVLPAAVIA
jgi:hypothetical protein